MVDWIIFFVYHVVASLLYLHLPKLLALYTYTIETFGGYRVGLKGIMNLQSGY